MNPMMSYTSWNFQETFPQRIPYWKYLPSAQPSRTISESRIQARRRLNMLAAACQADKNPSNVMTWYVTFLPSRELTYPIWR